MQREAETKSVNVQSLIAFPYPARGKVCNNLRLVQLFPSYNCLFTPMALPVPINSSLSALTGQCSDILEDANTAPHKGPCLLAITTPPSALGTALQFADWLCWAGLPQKSTLTPFLPAFPPFWQRESIITKWKAPKGSFLLRLKQTSSL